MNCFSFKVVRCNVICIFLFGWSQLSKTYEAQPTLLSWTPKEYCLQNGCRFAPRCSGSYQLCEFRAILTVLALQPMSLATKLPNPEHNGIREGRRRRIHRSKNITTSWLNELRQLADKELEPLLPLFHVGSSSYLLPSHKMPSSRHFESLQQRQGQPHE